MSMEQMGLVPFEQRFPLEIIWLEGEPLFNAQDVAEGLLLGESAKKMALSRMKPSRRIVVTADELKGCSKVTNCDHRDIANRGETFLREPGLYEMAMTSRSEGAEAFKDWVFEEVLPSIRKTGHYSLSSKPGVPALPQSYSEALRALADEVEHREAAERQLSIQAPKVEEYERFLSAHNEIQMAEAAKVLNFKGYGPINLFAFLRDQKVLMKEGERKNLPYQKYIEAGWFRVILEPFTKAGHEESENYRKTIVTPKGLIGIYRLLKAHKYPGQLSLKLEVKNASDRT